MIVDGGRRPPLSAADVGPARAARTPRSRAKSDGRAGPRRNPGGPGGTVKTGLVERTRIVESFNGRLRDELLSSEIFDTLAEARYLVDRWRMHYNHRRIQRALGRLTPAAFAARCPSEPTLRLA